MRAIVVEDEGGEAVLRMRDVPDPFAGPADLLVQVAYAGLNRTDLRRTQQHFSADAGAHVAGLEMSGIVTGVGRDVCGFALGDRVMAMANGCYAEEVVVDYRLAMPVPRALSLRDAAAVPVTFVTAHNALVTAGRLDDSSRVLIHAVASGVGLSAVQLARALGSRMIIGTSRAAGHTARLRELGVDLVADARELDFVAAVTAATDGQGVDVIIDLIGAGVLDCSLKVAAQAARIVSVGRMGGFTDTLDLDLLALKCLRVIGVTFRTLSIDQKQSINQRFMRDVGPLFASGQVRPLVDSVFRLEDAERAQQHMRANSHFGKVLLAVANERGDD